LVPVGTQKVTVVEAAARSGSAIRISAALRHLGRIESAALVMGAGDRFEIWNPEIAAASGDPAFRELARWQIKHHRRRAPRGGTRRSTKGRARA
jgi:MraZ protein